MGNDEDIAMLLTDRKFQSKLKAWGSYNEQQKENIYKAYNLSSKEFNKLFYLWNTLDFHVPERPSSEIESQLNHTLFKILAKDKKRRLFDTRFYKYFARIAAILIFPIIIYAGYLQVKTSNLNSPDQFVSVSSQLGTITELVLPDGSIAHLNAGSTISYPKTFSRKNRKVNMSGEVYFDVVKNEAKPMLIDAGDLVVKVYGTSFNINSFSDQNYTEVALVDGNISLLLKEGKIEGKDEYKIIPGQTATYNNQRKNLKVETGQTAYQTAWKDGVILFRNTRFQDVVSRLSRRFNVDIMLKDQSLADISMDATFHNESLDEILRLLAISTPFHFYYAPVKQLPNGSFQKAKLFIEKKYSNAYELKK